MANTILIKNASTGTPDNDDVVEGELLIHTGNRKLYFGDASDELSTFLINNGDWSGTDLSVANGGTGASTLTSNYVLLGNGTSSPQMIAPGNDGNVLTSTGSTWQSEAPAGGGGSGTVTSVATSGTENGLTLTGGTITGAGTITLGGTLAINNGDWSGTDLAVVNGGTGSSTAGDARTALGIGTAGTRADSYFATGAEGDLATGALPKSGGAMTGNITFSSTQTVDGRDVSADGSVLDTCFNTKAHIDNLAITQVGEITTGGWAATDIAVAHGGTGVSTLADGSVLIGSGTSAITALALGNTNILIGDGSGDPTVASLSGDATMTNAGVVSLAANSVDSDQYVDGSIDAAHIASSAVTTAKINADAVTNAKIADDAVDTENIADDAITAALIDDGAVVAAGLGSSAVTTAKINADAVTNAKIADDAVDTENIADDAITAALIDDGAVVAAGLGSSAVTTAKINATAVTQAKIAGEAIDESRLHVSNGGTNGYSLTFQSGNTGKLTWADISGGGGSGADTDLGNLASVAINTSLSSDTDNTDDLGSLHYHWKDIYFKGSMNTSAGVGLSATYTVGTALMPLGPGQYALATQSWTFTDGILTGVV